jgi:hypothetical protein
VLIAEREVLCLGCGADVTEPGPCARCGSDGFAIAQDSDVIEFTEGTVPCSGCGLPRRLKFRGWSYTWSFLWVARTTRKAGYVCDECADAEGAKALFFTAALGWWSVPSWFWVGWKSTYLNWRSTFAPPHDPLEWGALLTYELIDLINEAEEEHAEEAWDSFVVPGSPLASLTQAQVRLVVTSEGLYEFLGVSRTATKDQIKSAYRERALEVHPDLVGEPDAELMVALNNAWEVLGNQTLRDAYDWVEADRGAA